MCGSCASNFVSRVFNIFVGTCTNDITLDFRQDLKDWVWKKTYSCWIKHDLLPVYGQYVSHSWGIPNCVSYLISIPLRCLNPRLFLDISGCDSAVSEWRPHWSGVGWGPRPGPSAADPPAMTSDHGIYSGIYISGVCVYIYVYIYIHTHAYHLSIYIYIYTYLNYTSLCTLGCITGMMNHEKIINTNL